jgi:hypothetical protein
LPLHELLEETHRSPLVLALLNKNIEDITTLVHGTPQVPPFSANTVTM